MNAAAPWWSTLVVALVGLGGVLWSQWISARRDRAERQDRRRVAREVIYQDFHRVISDLTHAVQRDDLAGFGERQAEYMRVMLQLVTSGSPSLGPALDEVSLALGRIGETWPSTEQSKLQSIQLLGRHCNEAVTLMRSDAPDRHVPRTLRVWCWFRHTVRRIKVVRWRWREHWAVLNAELDQPVWPTGDDSTGRRGR
jgi:hypothetical protein